MTATRTEATWTIPQERSTSVGPHLEGFAGELAEAGFQSCVIDDYIREADRLGSWLDRRDVAVSSLDEGLLASFRQHVARCRNPKRKKSATGTRASGAARLIMYLRDCGVVPLPAPAPPPYSELAERFRHWLVQHRGLARATVRNYERHVRLFLDKFGGDPATYDVARIRAYVVDQVGHRERLDIKSTVTALRAFLRFLVAEGQVPTGVQHCVPAVACWRLASLPRYLEPADLERVLTSREPSTPLAVRDRAILLVLGRLGLRAGDVAAMTLDDIDWARGALRVRGKRRQEVSLPLPQDVGDALLAYLEQVRPRAATDRVFVAMQAPIRALDASTMSSVVRRALRRAGIKDAPWSGTHLLRHSAATAMLRSGSSLDAIATMLRHRSLATTAHYAKVDVDMLRTVVQPWPGRASC